MRIHRSLGGHVAAVSALTFVSGCSLLLDVQVASSGPCSAQADCPNDQYCVDFACRAGCSSDKDCTGGTVCLASSDAPTACLPADSGVAGSDGAVATDGGTDAALEAGSSDAASSPRDGSEDAPWESSAEGSANGGAACADDTGCDRLTQACVDGRCRILRWASPQSDALEPLPAAPSQRGTDYVTMGERRAQRVQVAQAGVLIRVGILGSTSHQPYSFEIALYSGEAYPQHPVFVSSTQICSTASNPEGRQEVPIDVSERVHVDAGTYWIAFAALSGPIVLQTSGQADSAESFVPDSGTPFMDPFSGTGDPVGTITKYALEIYAVVAIDPM